MVLQCTLNTKYRGISKMASSDAFLFGSPLNYVNDEGSFFVYLKIPILYLGGTG